MLKLSAIWTTLGLLLFAASPSHGTPYRINGISCPGPDPYYAYYGCPGLYAGYHGPLPDRPHSYWLHRRHRWTVYTW